MFRILLQYLLPLLLPALVYLADRTHRQFAGKLPDEQRIIADGV
jgi:cation transport regulator ChaC